jgi:hypothetical protein
MIKLSHTETDELNLTLLLPANTLTTEGAHASVWGPLDFSNTVRVAIPAPPPQPINDAVSFIASDVQLKCITLIFNVIVQ